MRFIIVLLFLWCFVNNVQLLAQEPMDSTVVSSDSMTLKDSIPIIEKLYPNPKTAALLGLAIPGAGHIYNKKHWWKAPIIYGAAATGVFLIDYNTKRYNLFQDAYCQKLIVEGTRDAGLSCEPYSRYTLNNFELFENQVELRGSGALRDLRDQFDDWRQLSWIFTIIGHVVLNSVWAYVDAHLFNFDISDDLSIEIQPVFEQPSNRMPGIYSGIGVAFTF